MKSHSYLESFQIKNTLVKSQSSFFKLCPNNFSSYLGKLRFCLLIPLFVFFVQLSLQAEDRDSNCDFSCDASWEKETSDVWTDDSSYQSLTNLEDRAQDFVLETKRLLIPGCPGAFNPSITRWQGSLLMCFRVRDPQTAFTNKIGFVYLDDGFNLVSAPTLLEMRGNTLSMTAQAQDARLITVGDKLYIVYSNMERNLSNARRMHIAEVHIDGDDFFIENSKCLSSFDNERQDRWEKNWVPFVYNENLFLARSLFPHQIFYPIPKSSVCETVASTWGAINWDWGVLRGGTPALLDGEEYLAFFHSSKEMTTIHSKGRRITHYFMGAYTFSKHPPFSITRMSPEPIIGKGFYGGPAYKTWKPLRVVFPCGFVFDEHSVWIVYGKQDHEIWVVKLDKQGLLSSLAPVDLL